MNATHCWTILALILTPALAHGAETLAAYQPVKPRDLKPGEIAVDKPGNCDKEGATYVLTQDVSAPTSALFLGKNVTLDLNGHTLTYAVGYQDPNYFAKVFRKHFGRAPREASGR